MINEKEILDLCATDMASGFKLLMDSFQKPIYYYVRRLLVSHEDTEDALQETFVKVYRNLTKFRGDSSLSTWIYRIATNESLRVLENRKKMAGSLSEEGEDDFLSKLKATEYVDYEDAMAVKFQAALSVLPEKQRLVFNLRYYDELEYEEIAKILDSKVATLKVNYHYAKDKIKDYILNH